jgi:predicted nucleotide-binding protein
MKHNAVETGSAEAIAQIDEASREMVARFLEQQGIAPVILHEKASLGKSIIEKIEHYSHVGFAIVLLTPDDEGREMGAETPLQPRGRQNVILELGFFLGRLGRPKVCALYRGEMEIPSDYRGVIYVPMDNGGAWRFKLAQEMRAAGFSMDMNKI